MNTAWIDARRILPLDGPRIVTVGVIAGTQILTGLRRDNGKWTNPGGHMDEGESLVGAAIRETKEEAGIDLDPSDLELVSSERVISHNTGKEFSVFCFIARIPKERASGKNDPDKEISQWKWIPIELGQAELLPKARHAKHDSILCHLGHCGVHMSKPVGITERRLSDEYTCGTEGMAIENIPNIKP